ncbi:kinesin [Thraustotheca clavata]|uniref:Glycylpeptide N-tetradecanoyltransferase n=1 Tax=Thraustotheca clavata TaxID=74557 RepID=A0A1W0AB03_9STRA|nr:kinesin [Thraustotheca clavata]
MASPKQEEIVSVEEQEEFLAVLKQLQLATREQAIQRIQKQTEDYKFWKTQPVPGLLEQPTEHCAIDKEKSVDEVRQTPLNMPAGFKWCDLDLTNEIELKELYDLLYQNYVEDDDNMFRFDYSMEFLKWVLLSPGFHKDWHVGVRNEKSGKLMAFIGGFPTTIRAYDNVMPMAEINYLCIHKKLRSKRLAPVLIKEITRRVNLRNIWQAIYTAGVVLPMPVSSCRYFHRSLNPKKLIEVGFSHLAPNTTMTRTIKQLKLPEAVATANLVPMAPRHVSGVTALLREYLKKFDLVADMNENEVAHWLLPRQGVVSSYVVEDPATHKVTDLASFYHLPSTIIGNTTYKTLFAAYSYYNVATTVPLVQLMQDLLILAKNEGMDVFNALNLMENEQFLQQLKFGIGSGELQYYLYNWRCPRMPHGKVGIVLQKRRLLPAHIATNKLMSSRAISFSRPATYNPELVRKATHEDDDDAVRRQQMKEELGLTDENDEEADCFRGKSNNSEWQQKCEDALAKLKVAIENEEKAQSSLSKLQLLSKSQTTILKTNFEKKLKAKEMVVRDLLQTITTHESKLRGSNIQFDPFDGEVDFTKADDDTASNSADPLASIRAELDSLTEQNLQLKKQLRNGNSSSKEVVGDSQLQKKVVMLENEKQNLLALLKDAQMKLTAAKTKDTATPTVPPAAPVASTDNSGEVKAAQAKCTQLEAELKKAEKKMQTLQSELNTAKAAPVSSKAEANSADQAKVTELQAKLDETTNKLAELVTSSAAKQEKLKQTAEAELNKLKEQAKKSILDLRKKLEVSSKSSSELTARLSKAKQQLSAQRNDMNLLRSNVTTLVQQLPVATKEIAKKIEERVKVQAEALSGVVENYRREMKERKRLFNMVQELQGNIRVLCRFRPISKSEIANGSKVVAKFNGHEEVSITGDKGKSKSYEFEHVFDMQSTQDQVFAQVKPLITSVLDGFNVCIFAYGQTGSGKTFTMSGSTENPGINPRALTELFALKQSRRQEYHDDIQVSIMEIYNEVIRDLLANNAQNTNLSVRQGPTGNFVQGLTILPVQQVDDVFNLITKGNQNRATSATDMNEHSSRSHSILSIYIKSTNILTNVVATGKLHLVDLAGSERLSKTGAEGQRLKEAQNINQSLSTLGNVIQARANKQKHVPYRDSSLTYLLQDSLGGDSKTLMVACSSPVDYNAEETFCTLNFAARTRSVEMGKASKNVATGKKE